ncbi:MAG: DUF2793 domain-containing protein [Alphaproteobacteria bacterium]
MTDTTNLALPYMEAAQAQKHVTHNEALRRLDAVIMLSVLDRDLSGPPDTLSDGDRYLVASGSFGDWANHDGHIAAWQDGAWNFYTPREGWTCHIADEDVLIVFDGASWIGCSTQNAAYIGVGTTADDTNRLAVASEAVLFNHAGNGVQAKLNKAAATNIASVLFQTNWSGRAEIGCVGNDDFVFKTSADGSNFATGLTLVSGACGVPRLPSFTVNSLPDAATAGAGALVYISSESGGAVLAFSDGAEWRRVTDRAVVS